MKNSKRDFNEAAECFLALSILIVVVNTITVFLQLKVNTYFGLHDSSSEITELIFNLLIICASISTFMKKRLGLIALILFYIGRTFFTLPHVNSSMFEYSLGTNIAYLMRDFLPFAICMFFKKNGVSGWKSMLGSNEMVGGKQYDSDSDDKSNLDFLKENVELNQDSIHDYKECKEDSFSSKIIGDSNANLRKKFSFKVSGIILNTKKKILISLCSILFISFIVSLMYYVNSKEYPTYIDGFYNRFKYCFSIPNNSLAIKYYYKSQKAKNANLEELRKEYLFTAWNAKPNNIEILDSISKEFYNLAIEEKSDSLLIKSDSICRKIIMIDPDYYSVKKTLISIDLILNKNKEAYKLVELILIDKPDDLFAIHMMCRKAYQSKDWEKLLYWGEKGYNVTNDKDKSTRIEIIYYYSKALFEMGYLDRAKKYYDEASDSNVSSILHDTFIEVGGIPCSIDSVQVENHSYDGSVLTKRGNRIYEYNTRYLVLIVDLKSERIGTFNFDVKLYYNGKLQHNDEVSPLGYTYSRNITFKNASDKKVITLGGWGKNEDGFWKKGNYKYEIWWKGRLLYSYKFEIYNTSHPLKSRRGPMFKKNSPRRML